MKRKWSYLVIAFSVLVLALAAPQFILAQEEITLEDLAEQVQDFVTQVQDIVTDLQDVVTRVETLEAVWEGPGAYLTKEGNCSIGVDRSLQDSSVLKYKEQFEEWPNFSYLNIKVVELVSETGEMAITYDFAINRDHRVTEIWKGCDFVESVAWEVED